MSSVRICGKRLTKTRPISQLRSLCFLYAHLLCTLESRLWASANNPPQGFLLSQLLFAFLPLLIFVCFVLSTAAFAAGVAIIFSLFWIFMAMVLLVPTLFVAFGVGVLVWVWAVSSFIIGRWMYGLIPGGFKGVARVNGPAGTKVVLLKDEAGFHAHKEEHD